VLGRVELVGQGVRVGRDQVPLRTAAPARGEHTAEVLRAYGYTDAQIAELRAKKAV
jgi:crotonobetainyl-CoA:carnitine CoA-transferase CaiB-like acyl-CoA transferase